MIKPTLFAATVACAVSLLASQAGAQAPPTAAAAKTMGLCEIESRLTAEGITIQPAAEINAAMKAAAEGPLKGILAYTEEPLVSSDLKGNSNSSIFSALDTLTIGNMVKVLSWYDNEWGYSCRVADVCNLMENRGL